MALKESNKIHDPFKSLRYPEFRSFLISQFLMTIGLLIQEVIIGYELYRLTHDPFVIGLVGLAEAIPFISLSLFGGHYADRLSKRKMILTGQSLIFLSSAVLFLTSYELLNTEKAISMKYIILGLVFFIGFCRAFSWPASGALKPFLIPRDAYENSATWSSSSWQVGAILGPGISGFLYSLFGFSGTLLIVMVLILIGLFFMSRVKDRKIEVKNEGNIFDNIKVGIKFVWKAKSILYSISLDLFSVLFGGVVAILPVFAEDILKVGPQGLGILRSAPSVGAVIVLIYMTKYSVMNHAWRTLLLAVAGFGFATLVFALSQNFILSVTALFFTGAFDSISVVIRQTILQLLVPDEMRGRVNAINGIFISTSNEVGAFESGLAAKLMGTVPSVVFGGVMTLIVVFYISLRSSPLFKQKFI